MKRFFLFFMLFFSLQLLFAQDIIYTKDNQKIDCKIVEVSSKWVKYIKSSNLNGPTFVEDVSNIISITYENGEVQKFDNSYDENSVEAQQANLQINLIQSQVRSQSRTLGSVQSSDDVVTDVDDEEGYDYNSVSRNDYSYNSNRNPEIIKIGRDEYKTSSGHIMDSDEMAEYFQANCYDAYKVWRRAKGLRAGGWTLMGCGLALNLGSLFVAAEYGYWTPATLSLHIVGGLCELACIPTIVVGYCKRNTALKVYNNSCAKSQPISLNFGVVPNGVGVALTF